MVGIHAEPVGEDYDIFAEAEFDEVQVMKIPKLALRGNREDLIYTAPDQVAVTCELSGTNSRDATIHFEAVDIAGNIVDQAEIPTTGSPIFLEMAPRADGLPTRKQTAGFHFEESWTPKLPGYGFYRFRATVASDGGIELGRSISAVVIRDIGGGISSDFGWSIQRSAPRGPRQLVQLFSQAGILSGSDFGCEPRKSAGRGVFLTIK